MTTHTIYMYAPDALVYDDDDNEWVLRADYDPDEHRVRVEITDDDATFNGDLGNSEVGDDLNQTANVYDMDDNLVASGLIYDELFFVLDNAPGSAIYVDQVEIGGTTIGYFSSAPIQPGVEYEQLGWADISTAYGNTYDYSEIPSVPCFGPGTHLLTPDGEVPVEWLAAGEKLITRDHGVQPVLWVGRFTISLPEMAEKPELVPYTVAENSFGPGRPTHPLVLSRQHRVLMTGFPVELHAGVDEAFAPVAFLEDGDQITQNPPTGDIEYTHVLLREHAIVMANGMWTESLFLGEEIETGLLRHLPRHLRRDFDLLLGHRQTARLCLKRWQVTAMMDHRPTVKQPARVHRSA